MVFVCFWQSRHRNFTECPLHSADIRGSKLFIFRSHQNQLTYERQISGRQMQSILDIREKLPKLFPLKLISNSKRLNLENGTEWTGYRGSERNGRFGEQ
jgi:hypothetical protein